MTAFECPKCGGTGKVPYPHVADGACFPCGGTGRRSGASLGVQNTPPIPELPEVEWADTSDWEALAKITQADEYGDRRPRLVLYEAGAVVASQPFVSKEVMAKALDIARRAAEAGTLHSYDPS